jgi:Tfp pilus assembly protein PilN
MVTLLTAAVVYLVIVSNQVNSGREGVGALAGELQQAERQAAALKPYHDFAQATLARRTKVASIADARFNWDRPLSQLAKVGPNGVWLTSAKGTLSPTTQVDGGADGDTSALRGALPGPALELAGCATRDGQVPAYMDGLYGMTGVTQVGFGRSERTGTSGGDTACGGTSGTRFSLVTYFKASPALLAVTQTATPATATPATATPAPSSTTAPPATPGAAPTTGGTP